MAAGALAAAALATNGFGVFASASAPLAANVGLAAAALGTDLDGAAQTTTTSAAASGATTTSATPAVADRDQAGVVTHASRLLNGERVKAQLHADTLALHAVGLDQQAKQQQAEAEAARAAEAQQADSGAAESSESDEADEADESAASTEQAPAATSATTASVSAGARFVLPTQGVFTSGFGGRWGTTHYGIDLANVIGTPVLSVADGTVVEAGPASGFGLWVRVQHDDGTITVYGHVNEILVQQGQRVAAGEEIATMGNRGNSTGPHLHFEVWLNGSQKIDPLPWLAARGIQVG
ncbi:M23 family metallopeptidase [Goodfellowiella coeruleoviolacea]